MHPFTFAPIAAILDAAYAAVIGLTHLLHPVTGVAAAAAAIVLITLLVRAALIPVGISQVKAEWGRRRIAPKLRELQKRYKKNPQLLQRKTASLYQAENISPLAGMLPTLAQAPIVSIVYALFIRGTVDGQPNALLTSELFGVPLGSHLLTSGTVGVLVFGGLLLVIAVVAWFSRVIALRLTPSDSPANGLTATLSWMPFITVLFAAFVPLAATLYLAVTTVWTLAERAILRRKYWREEPRASVEA